ncbi:hypothetical protein E3U44_11250 [Nitrosococcus wardiae]|uniref:DUF3987 domain-containing protein n=2 Tax=Nitrosococcus wardiae TaxID=1814290 RepID=A0A4P7C4I6_9GAMM|nr:hypothetical protein E3U44_11250 [Nitrosococcus wardiae]
MVLRSLLELVNSRTRQSWSLVEGERANVVLFDVDTEAGRSAWNANQGLTRESIRVWCSRQGPTEAVKYYLKKPYRYQYLVDLLTAVRGSKPEARKIAPVSAIIKNKSEKRLADTVFNPAEHFLGLLFSVIEEKQPVQFQYQDSLPLYVEPTDWEYFYQDNEKCLRKLCGSISSHITVEAITKELLTQRITSERMDGRSLQSLIWLAALEGSAGRPLLDWEEEGLLKLKQWPNLGVLRHSLDEMRLATFMTKQAATLATIAAYTGVTRQKTVNFINACSVVGLLETSIEVESVPELVTTGQKQGGIYGFMRRLRGGR